MVMALFHILRQLDKDTVTRQTLDNFPTQVTNRDYCHSHNHILQKYLSVRKVNIRLQNLNFKEPIKCDTGVSGVGKIIINIFLIVMGFG